MEFQAQRVPREPDLKLAKIQRELGELRKTSLGSSEDPAVSVPVFGPEAGGSSEGVVLVVVLGVGVEGTVGEVLWYSQFHFRSY